MKMLTAYRALPDLCRSMDMGIEVPGASEFVKHLFYKRINVDHRSTISMSLALKTYVIKAKIIEGKNTSPFLDSDCSLTG